MRASAFTRPLSAIFLAGALACPALAEDPPDCDPEVTDCEATVIDRPATASLAGPEQVENRLHIDSNQIVPLFPSNFARGYFDWKERQANDNGFSIGGDYSTAWLKATESLGEDTTFSGMWRVFGSWEATSDGQGNSGALIFKAEHRHAYGSNLAPGSLGFETGYVVRVAWHRMLGVTGYCHAAPVALANTSRQPAPG